MRLGVIDLGTNSIRLDARQIYSDGRARRLYREKQMVRLGQNAFAERRLDPRAVQRTVNAFRRFRDVADDLGLERVLALGTAALREARDRERFVSLIRKQTGIELKVISGSEEARLIALGILSNERLPGGTFALVDIGGGSTEITLCRGRKILRSHSFDIGVTRLQERFLGRFPPSERAVERLRKHVLAELRRKLAAEGWPRADWIIASGGTARALARLQRKRSGHGVLRPASVDDLIRELRPMRLSKLREHPALDPRRADLILAGAVAFGACMEALGASRARATAYSLRDGVIEEELRAQRSAPLARDPADEAARLAGRFELRPAQARRLRSLARTVFQRLQGVHRLEGRWLSVLECAALLRNAGESIGELRHAAHSAYIVRNSELPGLEDWERELVARLCRHHEAPRLGAAGAAGGPEPVAEAPASAYRRLLGMLRIIDLLDGELDRSLRLKRVTLQPKGITLTVSGSRHPDLEQASFAQLQRLWRETLGRPVGLRFA